MIKCLPATIALTIAFMMMLTACGSTVGATPSSTVLPEVPASSMLEPSRAIPPSSGDEGSKALDSEAPSGLQGDYIKLIAAPSTMQPHYYRDLLEFPSTVVISSYGADSAWIVEQFFIESGRSVYPITSSDHEKMGILYGLDYLYGKDNYDYCLRFERGTLYRSSQNPSLEEFVEIPDVILPFRTSTDKDIAPYHFFNDRYVWAAENGIMLSDSQGQAVSNPLPNNQVDTVYANAQYPEAYKGAIYTAPRFVNKGTCIVAQVRTQQDDLVGVVVYNLQANKVTLAAEYGPPYDVKDYPVADQYMCMYNGSTQIIDAANATILSYPLNFFYYTYDCKSFIQVEGIDVDSNDFKAYLCSATALKDRSKLLLYSNDIDSFQIADMTENYFIATNTTVSPPLLALVPY